MKPVTDASEIPMAVHGTNREAWKQICEFAPCLTLQSVCAELMSSILAEQGLSKMTRNHIHLAQGVPSSGVISGTPHWFIYSICLAAFLPFSFVLVKINEALGLMYIHGQVCAIMLLS